MKLTQDKQGQVCVLAVKGELTAEDADRFDRTVHDCFEEQVRDFVIDLSETEVIDSKGLESLLALQDRCADLLGQVRLAATPAVIEQVLHLTRLSGRFDRHETVGAAIQSLRV